MENLLRRLLGLYFVVAALAFVPAALFYIGVENASGPWWLLPAVPLAQGVVFGTAGFLLSRLPRPAVPVETRVVFPPMESLLQLLGVYFIVEGLSSAVRPGVDMWFFSETWFSRLGNLAGAAVWLVAGWILAKHPEVILKALQSGKPLQPTSGASSDTL